MLPWTLLLPGFLRFLCRRSPRAAAKRPPALGFFGLAALWSLVFFSAAGCKRAVYILPALPPVALALGCYLNALIVANSPRRSWARLCRRGSRLAYRAAVLALLLGTGAGLLASYHHLIRPTTGYALAGASLAGAAVAVWFRQRISWPVCAAATFAVLLAGVQFLQPAYNRQYSLRDCLHDAPQTAALPVVCYPQGWDSVKFYLPKADVRVYGPDQRRGFCETFALGRARCCW